MANTITGIIRRIDDLGRIVIPREIRRSLRVHEGDPFEIFIDKENRSVTFIPYCPMSATFLRDSRAIIGAMRHTHPEVKVLVYDAVGDINTQSHNNLSDETDAEIAELVHQCRTVRRSVRAATIGDDCAMAGVVPIIIDGDFLGFVIVYVSPSANKTEHDFAMFESAMKSAESLVDFMVKTHDV